MNMHPRNPYRDPLDFASLSRVYPELQPFLIDLSRSQTGNEVKFTINFKDERALRCLTQAILLRDFGIQLSIPVNRLCPPIPNRMNYILWIQDILSSTNAPGTEICSQIRGIDIGTGATAIYPILGCMLKEDWNVIGTEIDDASYRSAQGNIEVNALQSRITIRRASRDGSILFPLEDEATTYDFVMCNPPFYSSNQEIEALSKAKASPPSAACTGSEIEMIYQDGGETGFVSKMVEESTRFGGRCRWYTSMLGKMSSVVKVVDLLRARGINNYAITEFVQGQTRRWAVGWSFLNGRLPDSISRISLHPRHALTPYMPPRNTLQHVLPAATTSEDLARYLEHDLLSTIEGIRVTIHTSSHYTGNRFFRIEADENTWSRSARRKKKRKLNVREEEIQKEKMEWNRPDKTVLEGTQVHVPVLVCDVRILCSSPKDVTITNDEEEEIGSTWMEVDDMTLNGQLKSHTVERVRQNVSYSLEFQWVYGRERDLFENFTSHLGTKIWELVDRLPSDSFI